MRSAPSRACETGSRPIRWAVLVSLFLAQLLVTPAGFILLELLDQPETTTSQEFDDVLGQIHRLRFVRDPKVATSLPDSEPSTLDSLPPLDTSPRPASQAVSVLSSHFEHHSTLTRRSRAPGARPPADSLS